MELMQGARDKREVGIIRSFLRDASFRVLPLTEHVGHRALIYVAEYDLKADLGVADALIAASAVENGWTLCTGNTRHYRAIRDLSVKSFKP
jgi:predicted nucleic acid-binding protein